MADYNPSGYINRFNSQEAIGAGVKGLFDKLNESDKRIDHSDVTAYNNIYALRQSFIRSGGTSDTIANNFNFSETPGNFYFMIFFHFNTGFGLLNQNREEFVDSKNPWNRVDMVEHKNTAANYLWTNLEFQRLEMLDDFVKLLSNINTYSPWYFQSIEGLGEALIRSEYTPAGFNIPDEPKTITIKCLEDAYDNRIATLLDLYKTVCFSKTLHKDIVPANLRRFDMSIYIVNTPIGLNTHYRDDGSSASFSQPSYTEWRQGSNQVFASSKLLEFQGCEISANSAATGYAEVKNNEPFQMKHDIIITFQDVKEQRYNEFLDRIIGDYIFSDLDYQERKSDPWAPSPDVSPADGGDTREDVSYMSKKDEEDEAKKIQGATDEMNNEVTVRQSKILNFLKNQGTQVINGAISTVAGKLDSYTSKLIGTIKKYVMGNLYYGLDTIGRFNLSNYTNKAIGIALDSSLGKATNIVSNTIEDTGKKVRSNIDKGMGKLYGAIDRAASLGWVKK